MALDELYDRGFHMAMEAGSDRSARVIVPLVVQQLRPLSVVDVGCGSGSWLKEFKRHGAREVLGIDGSRQAVELRLEEHEFVEKDLAQPLTLGRMFDLAVCLEVVEHLPKEYGPAFIAQLTRLAPAVLFSAAVPYQGGTGHVNEQWPEYWAEHFSREGFVAIDTIRPDVWTNPEVEFWYAQNTLLFVHPDILRTNEKLARAASSTRANALARVHPALYVAKVENPALSLRTVALSFWKLLGQWCRSNILRVMRPLRRGVGCGEQG